MSVEIPDDPDVYFREFFPEQFRLHRDRFPPGDSAAAVVYRMPERGAWSFQVKGGELQIDAEATPDAKLALESSAESFHTLFVERTREEVARKGGLTEGSKAALKPLLLTEHKKSVCESTRRSLALELSHARTPHLITVTPGAGEATKPGATVRMKIDDYLAIQTGKRTPTTLFMMGKLKVKGDLAFALKLNPLLA